jgi:hypothetical protein
MSKRKDALQRTRVPKKLKVEKAKEILAELVTNPMDIPLEALATARSVLIERHQMIVDLYTQGDHLTIQAMAKTLDMNHAYLGQILRRPDVSKYLELYNVYHRPNHVRQVDDLILKQALIPGNIKAQELFLKRHGLIRNTSMATGIEVQTNNADGSNQITRIIIEGI